MKRINKSLLAFSLVAVCFVAMGASCRSTCLDQAGLFVFSNGGISCGGGRDACEAEAAATLTGADLKAARASCRVRYDECVALCKQFPTDEPDFDIPTGN